MSSYDLAVVYRIYPKVSKVPLRFADDKLRLSEVCLASFKRSLADLRVKMYVLLDSCPPEYEALFTSRFEAADLELIRLAGAGNFATFKRQLSILCEQTDAEHVYLAEDDYFYLDGQFKEILEFARSHNDAHFVAPYDHLDYYTLDLHRHGVEVRSAGGRHWRTANSTTLTFMTSREVLRKTRRVFETFANGSWDASLWLNLTKHAVFNPARVVRYTRKALRGDDMQLKVLVKAWLHGWRQTLFGRRYKLWVPVPSVATHMQFDTVAPGVDWGARIDEAAAED